LAAVLLVPPLLVAEPPPAEELVPPLALLAEVPPTGSEDAELVLPPKDASLAPPVAASVLAFPPVAPGVLIAIGEFEPESQA
jgi:hypothetical protein